MSKRQREDHEDEAEDEPPIKRIRQSIRNSTNVNSDKNDSSTKKVSFEHKSEERIYNTLLNLNLFKLTSLPTNIVMLISGYGAGIITKCHFKYHNEYSYCWSSDAELEFAMLDDCNGKYKCSPSTRKKKKKNKNNSDSDKIEELTFECDRDKCDFICDSCQSLKECPHCGEASDNIGECVVCGDDVCVACKDGHDWSYRAGAFCCPSCLASLDSDEKEW